MNDFPLPKPLPLANFYIFLLENLNEILVINVITKIEKAPFEMTAK